MTSTSTSTSTFLSQPYPGILMTHYHPVSLYRDAFQNEEICGSCSRSQKEEIRSPPRLVSADIVSEVWKEWGGGNKTPPPPPPSPHFTTPTDSDVEFFLWQDWKLWQSNPPPPNVLLPPMKHVAFVLTSSSSSLSSSSIEKDVFEMSLIFPKLHLACVAHHVVCIAVDIHRNPPRPLGAALATFPLPPLYFKTQFRLACLMQKKMTKLTLLKFES